MILSECQNDVCGLLKVSSLGMAFCGVPIFEHYERSKNVEFELA